LSIACRHGRGNPWSHDASTPSCRCRLAGAGAFGLQRILGSPSSIAEFDTDTWYYISQKTRNVAFFKPELVDQEVVAVDFAKDGTVRDIRHRGFEDRVAVTPNPNATPAPGREFSFWEQLVGNFGRFSGGSPGGMTGGGGGGGTGVPGIPGGGQ
jgi:hypothetical protein